MQPRDQGRSRLRSVPLLWQSEGHHAPYQVLTGEKEHSPIGQFQDILTEGLGCSGAWCRESLRRVQWPGRGGREQFEQSAPWVEDQEDGGVHKLGDREA